MALGNLRGSPYRTRTSTRPSTYLLAFALAILSSDNIRGQQIITTVAGGDWVFPASTPIPALSAPLGNVEAVATDNQGRTYLADASNNMAMVISPDGQLSVLA